MSEAPPFDGFAPESPPAAKPAGVDVFTASVQFLPTLFKMLGSTLPFTPPTTEAEMEQWFAAVAPFSPDDLKEAGVRLAAGRRVRPTMDTVVATATLVREERAARRQNAESVFAGAASGSALARKLKTCPGCGIDVPGVALTRRLDNTVSARLCPCACFVTGDRRFTRVVAFSAFVQRRLDLSRINTATVDAVNAMLVDWQPPHHESRAYVEPAFDHARQLMAEEES